MERWVRNNVEKLTPKDIVEYEDTAWLIRDVLKSFKEKTPGLTGITRNILLKAHNNVLRFLRRV